MLFKIQQHRPLALLCGFFSFIPMLHAEILPAATTLMSNIDTNQFESFTQTRTSGNVQPSFTFDNLNHQESTPIQVDTGYSFSLEDNFDVYLATRLTALNKDNGLIGISSGVDFQLSNKLKFSSGLGQQYFSFTNETDTSKNQTFFELSSSYRLTDKVHFFATYDHQIEQNKNNNSYQVGMGFRF